MLNYIEPEFKITANAKIGGKNYVVLPIKNQNEMSHPRSIKSCKILRILHLFIKHRECLLFDGSKYKYRCQRH